MLHDKSYKAIPGLSEVCSKIDFCIASSHAPEADSYGLHFGKKGPAELVAFS